MKWTVAELHKLQYEAMTFDETIDLSSELKAADPDIRDVSLIRVEGRADIDSHKVTFHLHITGKFVLPCSRTLVDVDYPVDIRSTETFLFDSLNYELDDTEETHEVKGGVVDLAPVVYELLLLEVPIQVLSPDAGDANLPEGRDWKVMTEEQLAEAREREKEKVDPRLAGLAKLLEKNNKDEKQK